MSNLLDSIFKPKSVAVIGASTRYGSIGRSLFDKLLRADFNGPVFPVNPNAKYVGAVKAYPSIADIPDDVELAIIVVAREHVLNISRQCGEKGVKALIVITAGFKEIGGQGEEAEQELIAICEQYGMRMIGPNCMGVVCTDPEIRLDATFAGSYPRRGNIAFASQSGALGVTILDYAASLNLGVSMFASIGNKADISGNDLLTYWKDDDSIGVILMYLESFGDPHEFVKIAREAAKKKPIVVVKSGRTQSGARAVSSHTGALTGADHAYDALFAQCRVLRADTIEEMFDFAIGLSSQPLPRGNQVAIITNAGGPAIMAADVCENLGLTLRPLSEKTQELLRERLLPEASVKNPVDLLPAADEKDFMFALEKVLDEDAVDSAIVIFVPPLETGIREVATGISKVAAKFDKPVIGCLMGMRGVETGFEELKKHSIPAFPFPESASRCLAALVKYSNWKRQPTTAPEEFAVDRNAVRTIIDNARNDRREHLSDAESFRVLACYGIPVAQGRFCKTWEEVQKATTDLGFPVVLKISSAKLLHKTEAAGVRLNLKNREELAAAFLDLESKAKELKLDTESKNYFVQQMIAGGREVLIGIKSVPNFGSVVAFGLGGIYVEALKDIALRAVPLCEEDAASLVKSIRGIEILKGVRGEKPILFDQLHEIILRVSQLAYEFPEISEMDINPFLVSSDASRFAAVDARFRIRI